MANNLNELNELIEKIIDEGNEITKINYGLFSNFEEINRGAFGTVRKATWGNKIIALKNLYMTENAKFWGCYQLDYEEPIKKNGEKIFEIKDYEVFQYL
ncbi:43542_t:CDS:2 [Gigaspora margarita]|uniref:43542_t:CDS:1 n=1 Tax=Gigaspora margarita TaxID=4874 RepID=A0ABM8W3T4_GIGMA|nr:43542_t:CDS:2 [Gigaspora margarita]